MPELTVNIYPIDTLFWLEHEYMKYEQLYGKEPKIITVNQRTFADIKSQIQSNRRFIVAIPQRTILYGLKFNNSVIVADGRWEDELATFSSTIPEPPDEFAEWVKGVRAAHEEAKTPKNKELRRFLATNRWERR